MGAGLEFRHRDLVELGDIEHFDALAQAAAGTLGDDNGARVGLEVFRRRRLQGLDERIHLYDLRHVGLHRGGKFKWGIRLVLGDDLLRLVGLDRGHFDLDDGFLLLGLGLVGGMAKDLAQPSHAAVQREGKNKTDD